MSPGGRLQSAEASEYHQHGGTAGGHGHPGDSRTLSAANGALSHPASRRVVVRWVGPRLRLPDCVGYILLGVLVGPHVLGIIPQNAAVANFFAELGKLLLMFFVGLDIDLNEFARARRRAAFFGVTTFALPFACSIAVAHSFGYSPVSAVLVGSLIASHTLIAFPMVSAAGLATWKWRLITLTRLVRFEADIWLPPLERRRRRTTVRSVSTGPSTAVTITSTSVASTVSRRLDARRRRSPRRRRPEPNGSIALLTAIPRSRERRRGEHQRRRQHIDGPRVMGVPTPP